jgi:hypothetical protein
MHKILGNRKQDEQEKVDHNFLNHLGWATGAPHWNLPGIT